jgi:transposase
MLEAQLRHVDYLDEEIGRLDEEIKERMLPFEEDLELLDTIPGVARRTAETILAEIGSNMDQYPSPFMFLGRAVSGSERKRRKTIVRQDAKREQEAPKYACRSREGCS